MFPSGAGRYMLWRAAMVTESLNAILCPAFHGATLLGFLLNRHSKVTCLGDTLPERHHLDYFCSCSKRIAECEFWRAIDAGLLTERFSREHNLLPMVPRLSHSPYVNRKLNLLMNEAGLRFGPGIWKLAPWATRGFSEVSMRFAELACSLQGTEVFVDGTKKTARFLSLMMLVQPRPARILQLTRDPRAYVHSCTENWASPSGPERLAQDWFVFHDYVRLLPSRCDVEHLIVRYEDLCQNPATEMARVFSFLGLENEEVTGPAEQFSGVHHLIGNRMLISFDGTVTLDTRWREAMPEAEQKSIISQAGAAAEAFGYT